MPGHTSPTPWTGTAAQHQQLIIIIERHIGRDTDTLAGCSAFGVSSLSVVRGEFGWREVRLASM